MEKGNHLLYISLLLSILESASANALTKTDAETVAWQHEEGRLRCNFTGDAYAVFWSKINESNSQDRDQKAVFFNENFESPEKRFVMDETTYALIISDLVISDEGKYVCQVALQNGNDFEIITHLTVNAMASDPVINKCDNAYQTNPNLCTYQATHNAPNFNLACKVSGFKPNVSLVWYRFDQRQVPLNSVQRNLPDGTSERIVTIGVSAKNGTDQNFTCSATGEAVTGPSSALINVLPLPVAQPERTPKGLSQGSLIGIVICSLVVICLISIACVIGVALYLRQVKKLPPRGLANLNRIPCLKVEPAPEPEYDQEAILLQQMTTELEEMRRRIGEYTSGTAAKIHMDDACLKVNINLFGQMSAGKSSLINSLFYAYKGEFMVVAEEGGLETGGGKTRSRIPHPLTEHIRLVDNRGMNDFSSSHLDDIKLQIRGEQGLQPKVRIEQNKEREVHCAVFVYHHMESHGLKEAGNFINLFNEYLNNHYDRSPMVVITHRSDIQDLPVLRGKLQTYGIPEKNIFAFENYTIKSDTEDLAKHIELLKFLWAALGECDRNVYCLNEKRKEKPLKASEKKERHQTRSKDLEANKQENENEGGGILSAIRGWFGYK